MAGLSWDIGQSFEYLGYFMVGYSIRKMFTNKNNCKAIIAILIGAFWIVCASGLVYKEMTARYEIISPYCLFIVLASLFIFIGFTLLDIRKESANLSNLTFYIYLIHAGVWNFISKVFYHAFGKNFLAGLNGAIWIPIFIVIVFSISYLLSKFYLWIWHKLDKEKKITNYLIKKVRLYT
ncbi:hypothetical protein D5281_18100 [bacterium 1xD42-62]|uniref:Uncharacterized protein n=2 Tax=Parablautia muri TaxID=2320879 RepID=A0A9X5BIL2_9FIRM|nr:hypothetical protein [Parablautia muri]